MKQVVLHDQPREVKTEEAVQTDREKALVTESGLHGLFYLLEKLNKSSHQRLVSLYIRIIDLFKVNLEDFNDLNFQVVELLLKQGHIEDDVLGPLGQGIYEVELWKVTQQTLKEICLVKNVLKSDGLGDVLNVKEEIDQVGPVVVSTVPLFGHSLVNQLTINIDKVCPELAVLHYL